jgi:hypothetical protein
MTFDELLTQVIALLQREERVSYRALKRRFTLDDEYLEDVKAELIQAKRLARDEDGAVLVWAGNEPKATPVVGDAAPVVAGSAAPGNLPLQARPDPGRCVSVLAQEHPPAVSPAHCPGGGGALSRHL